MSEEEAGNVATVTPAGRIAARTKQLEASVPEVLRVTLDATMKQTLGRAASDSELAAFVASHHGVDAEGMIRIGFALAAIVEELDREAERRADWEKRVEAFARAQGVEI